ncbi:hypothetical protein V8G54_029549 [Vigna mungo]|uniref:PB1-like domain-containing protein n=1 Tax=Vigna mungo TaxID=3915 RepID=A0AAQ3RJ97_VIGMU
MNHIQVVIHHGGKFVNEGCLKYEGQIETLYFDPDVWSYFVVVSVVKSLGYDGFKELWYFVGCALTDDVDAMKMVTLAHLNERVHLYVVHNVPEAEVIPMIEYNVDEGGEEEGCEGGEGAQLPEGIEDGGVPADGERIEVVVGQAEEVDGEAVVSAYELQEERIKAEEVVSEAGEVDAMQRTEAAEVELQTPSIEVDRVEAAEVEVQADSIEVVRAEAGEVEVEVDRIQAQDGEGDTLHGQPYRIEVGDLDDVQVGDWSSTQESDDAEKDGEMGNEDGLVDIDVQCDVSESCSDLEVEVEPFLPGSDSDMDKDEINDSSWFNDEW